MASEPEREVAGVGRARPPLNRYSTREIVLDATGNTSPFGGPKRLGHNPSWIKAADVDAALTAQSEQLAALIQGARALLNKLDAEADNEPIEHYTLNIDVEKFDEELKDLRALLDAQENTP